MTGQLLVNENWNNRAESVGTWRISTPNMAPLNQAMCAQLTPVLPRWKTSTPNSKQGTEMRQPLNFTRGFLHLSG